MRINDQPRENALMFTQILLTLQVTVWRDRLENLYMDIGDKNILYSCAWDNNNNVFI